MNCANCYPTSSTIEPAGDNRDETKAMTKMDRQAEDREALERLLDIYGADRTRWPARERLRFASLISEDAAAARLLTQADALDRLLDQAPRTSEADIEALKERIMAAALRAGPVKLAVVGVEKPLSGRGWPAHLRRPAFAAKAVEWSATAVLAASLVLGVMLGSAGTFDGTMQQVAEATGFSSTATDVSHLALSEEIDGQPDEDLL
jgi:hypothetical protein